jgi:hypothetical protein
VEHWLPVLNMSADEPVSSLATLQLTSAAIPQAFLITSVTPPCSAPAGLSRFHRSTATHSPGSPDAWASSSVQYSAPCLSRTHASASPFNRALRWSLLSPTTDASGCFRNGWLERDKLPVAPRSVRGYAAGDAWRVRV